MMKMLPHCHPVEAQLLAPIIVDHTFNVSDPRKKLPLQRYIQGLLFCLTEFTPPIFFYYLARIVLF